MGCLNGCETRRAYLHYRNSQSTQYKNIGDGVGTILAQLFDKIMYGVVCHRDSGGIELNRAKKAIVDV